MEEIGTDALPEELSLPSAPTGTTTKKRTKKGATQRGRRARGTKRDVKREGFRTVPKTIPFYLKNLSFPQGGFATKMLSLRYIIFTQKPWRDTTRARKYRTGPRRSSGQRAGSVGRRERESEVALTLSYSSSRNSPCRSR